VFQGPQLIQGFSTSYPQAADLQASEILKKDAQTPLFSHPALLRQHKPKQENDDERKTI
jgi:hypothetical protein